MGTKYSRHPDLRGAILDLARKLLEDGTDWSMRQVAKACGVSSGAPYRYFATKRDAERALCVIGWTELRAIHCEKKKNGLVTLVELNDWLAKNTRLFHLMLDTQMVRALRRSSTKELIVDEKSFDEQISNLVKQYWLKLDLAGPNVTP